MCDCTTGRITNSTLQRPGHAGRAAGRGETERPDVCARRAGGGDHFTGRVEPNQLVFDLRHYDAYYYGFYGDMFYADIFEELSATSYLEIWGRVLAVGTSGSLSGPLDGAFEHTRAIHAPSGTRRRLPDAVRVAIDSNYLGSHVPLDAAARNRRRTTF